MTLSQLLRVARAVNGFSLSEAAPLLGITKTHLHEMECGRSSNPRLSTLKAISKVYGISASDLFSAEIV